MKWIILNGSPKGEVSATIQSIKYLEKTRPEHIFEYINVVKEVKEYEYNPQKLTETCEKIKNADVIIWAFPVYHLLVHSQYKRFIELIFERKLESYFHNKLTAAFSTSIHFFDHTAHNYIHGICDDLKMNYVEYLSHDMNDLTKEEKRAELNQFAKRITYWHRHNLQSPREYQFVAADNFVYKPNPMNQPLKTNKIITIITDTTEDDHNINEMIYKYVSSIDGAVRIENIHDIKAKGYCLGCCKCAYENKCVYHDKDDYRQRLDAILADSDALIYAGTIKDRYLSSRFKWFFDRSFCYTHIPIYTGKQMGFMLSGPLSQLENLKQMLETYSQMGANLIGFMSDECKDTKQLDKLIEDFAKRTVLCCENDVIKSNNFLGVGGHKIFRDTIYGHLGGMFKGDYKFFKAHGLFDFPSVKERFKSAMMRLMMGQKFFRKEVQKNMIHYMIRPHQKVLAKVKTK